MKSILKNSNGNAVSTGGKLLGSPEGENLLQTLVTGKGTYGGQYLFYNYTGNNVDFIADIDFSANTTCRYMFNNCTNLTAIPQLDTSNVTNMGNMFSSCSKLTTIPQLNTSNVADMNGMFYNCTNLQEIDITSMDKITSTSGSNNFASNCKSLTKLIIRTMTKVPSLNSNTFTNCYHFTGTVNSTYNPDGLKDGRIYVPDNMVDSLKSATNWSKYADCIVPLSTLEE